MSEYVWIKRDLFEYPKHQGYTGIRDSAGTWPLEEAQRYGLPIKAKYDRSHDHYALPIEAAPEFTNACFDDLARDHLKAKCAAKDAEIKRLQKALRTCAMELNEATNILRHNGLPGVSTIFYAAVNRARAEAGGSDA